MNPLMVATIINATVQTGIAINDMFLAEGRKEGMEMRAKTIKASLDLQKAQARTNVMRNQKEIDQELQELYGEVRVQGAIQGFNTLGSEYALAREGGKVKENNLEGLQNFETQIEIEKLNADLDVEKYKVDESNRMLSNFLGAMGSGIQAYGQHQQGLGKSGATVSSAPEGFKAPQRTGVSRMYNGGRRNGIRD